MRVVLDTNVVVSALLWAGIPGELIHLARDGRVDMVTSAPLLAELTDVLERPRFAARVAASGLTIDQMVDGYAALAHLVRPEPVAGVAPDPDDDVVLGTALAGNADLIVSGDAHLLGIGKFQGISITQAASAVAMILTRGDRQS